MKVFTFDLETENYKSNKRLASPFDKRNYIVQIGWSINGGKPQEQYYTDHHREHVLPVDIINSLEKGDIINGFNIKFDLLWVWEEPCLQAALKRGVTIYDGQYAEYLMGGMTQDVQMTSMNKIAEKYGGGCKLDAVKEMWEEGYLTSEIPRNLLTDYLVGDGKELVGDVQNTWLIFCGQIKRMKEDHPPEFRKMFKFRMDGLLATTEMEYNGMHIDTDKAEKLRTDLIIELDKATQTLESFIPDLPPELEFNWGSPTHKSCLIFGGVVKYDKWVAHTDDNGNVLYAQKDEKYPLFNNTPLPPEECRKAGDLYVLEVPEGTPRAFNHKDKWYLAQDVYKSGKRAGEGKTKNVKVDNTDKPKGAKQPHYFKFDGFTKPHGAWKSEQTDAYDNPLYSTASGVIEKLAERGLPFTTALATRTALAKDLGTYYWTENKKGDRKGMLTLVDESGIIHHKLNHTSTVTSRMSSSDPNMQNIPRGGTSNVKKMFTSRFTEDGRMAEIDYSQLEVVVQGVLSKDKQLVEDLNNKVDFHCKRLAAKLGEDYDSVWRKHHIEEDPEYGRMRTNAKSFSFQRAYGAGVDAIVTSTGMPKEEVEALVSAEERLYPSVIQFDKRLEATISKNRIPTANKLYIEGVAFTQGESHWDSPTGTRYVWREGITPEFMHKNGKYTGFSPTERKNYPVQGFGGEIVQTMLGIVFRYFLENDRFNNKVKLVNTVHDCVLLDGQGDELNRVALEVQKILETVPEVFNKAYPELNVNVPFPCETEVGADLFNMSVIH
jgi:DNA polymerase I-like protein with 3'-5' exonuclease and polymerase domains